jgi:glycosyltransferase involved in cell wall biosynthesis
LLVLASTYPRWVDDHEPGFVHELSRRLCATFEVTVVTPHSPGARTRESIDGVEVVRYRYAPGGLETLVHGGGMVANVRRAPWKALILPGFLVGQYFAARRVLRQREFSAIHAHWLLPQGLVAWWLAKRAGIPYVVTSHGGDLFGLKGAFPTRLKRAVARSASAMTVVSTAMRDEAARIGLSPPSIEVLPMGVDLLDRFVSVPGDARVPDRLLFVGRLVPKKGLRYLLDAMPLVLAKRLDTTLDIAGFGPELPALQEQARRMGIDRSVRFVGAMPQRDLPVLYRQASLFVAPFIRDDSGDQEGLPVALMEAIGCGCPVVVGNVAGVQDLLGESCAAVCVDPRDPVALAAAILRALENPVGAALQANAIRQIAAERVDWTRIAAAYARLIGEAASAPASR